MADRIPQIKPKELIKILEKLGFVIRRQTGSHVILRHLATKDIKRGLLFAILKQSNISQAEFLKLL